MLRIAAIMLRVIAMIYIMLDAITVVRCQPVTLLDSSSSYLAYEGLVLQPTGGIIFSLRTYSQTHRLNATVLYIQGRNRLFVYVRLLNGNIVVTDGTGAPERTTQPAVSTSFDTNRWVDIQVSLINGELEFFLNNRRTPLRNSRFDGVSPIFIGGIPNPPPFQISYNDAIDNIHLLGCVRDVQFIRDPVGLVNASLTANSDDVVFGSCGLPCLFLECDSDRTCNEYYTHGTCHCRGLYDSREAQCNEPATIISLDGNHYKCYSVPRYNNPSIEGETIRMYVENPPPNGTLLTGRQEQYRFSLYIVNRKLHYEVLQNSIQIVAVSSTQNIETGVLQIIRNVSSVEITINNPNSSRMILAMQNIFTETFGSVRFTEICVGGGILNNRIYSGELQGIYYNLYYLSDARADFREMNVTKVNRVNFDDPRVQILLPGNLADGSITRIELTFRTSQQNATLLHSENSANDHFHIFTNKSQIYVNLQVDNQVYSNICNLIISPNYWYTLTVEPVIGSEGGDHFMVSLLQYGSGSVNDQCNLSNLPTGLISSFISSPVVVGGMAGGLDGLVGCLELTLNEEPLNLEVLFSDNIHADKCQPCDIPSPCPNGTSCQPLDDRTFTCNCAEPLCVTISPSGSIQGAMVGSPQVINCTVSTISEIESSSVMISWMGPGGAITTTNDRVSIGSVTDDGNNMYTSSLQFTYLMEGDEGMYTCNVIILNTGGSQSVEIQSVTIPTPIVKVTALNSTQTVGQSLTLQCEVTTVRGITSRVDIVWRRNNTIINSTRVTAVGSSPVYRNFYTISQLNTSHDGEMYECRLIIRTRPRIRVIDIFTVRLDTNAPPQINVHPSSVTIKVDNDSTSVTFTCMAYEALSYYWERETGDIPLDAVGINTNTLTLHNILPPDSGRYRCVADNEHGITYSNYAVLTVGAFPPVVSILPEDEIQVMIGSRVEFVCSATGMGANSFLYQWLLNDLPVADQDTSTLIIGAVSENNTGDYQCFVRNQYNGIGQSKVTRLISDQLCNAVTVGYSGFNITWNKAQSGLTLEAPCTAQGLDGTVRRRCIIGDIWEEFIECFREETRMLLDQATNLSLSINELNETGIINMISSIASALVNVTDATQEAMFAQDINLAVNTVYILNNVTETVIANLTVNATFFEDTTSVIDNMLSDANQNNWKQLERTSPSTSQALVRGAEQVTKLLSETLTNDTTEAIKARPNIVIKAEHVSNDNEDEGYVFPDEDDNLTAYTGGIAQLMISSSLMQNISSEELTITSTVIRNNSGLRLPSSNVGFLVLPVPASPIFSLQIDPLPASSTLEDNPIMMVFDVDPTAVLSEQSIVQSEQSFTVDDVSCNFYDYTLVTNNNLNQIGGWSTEGVIVDRSNSNDTLVSCLTKHLTSFAVLVSIQDERPPDEALSIISYIGCSISLVCLCASIIVLSCTIYKTKENKNHLFIHLNLCIALALGLVAFIAGIENATSNEAVCKFVAALLQYLFISAFCWMLCEGVMLYMMLVTVFGNRLNSRRFFFILGWGPAIPIVAISAGLVHRHYGTENYCWIKSDDGAIAAFIVPIVTIMLVNCVFFIITLKVLWQRKAISKQAGSNENTAKNLLKAVIILLPLLGITWIIGILAVNNDTQVFAWIFAILNSLQGAFIFLLHVIRNKQVAREIRERYGLMRKNKAIRRLLSIRGRDPTNTLGMSSKARTSQSTPSETTDHGKKTFSSGTGGGASTLETSFKETSVFEDSIDARREDVKDSSIVKGDGVADSAVKE